MQTTGVIFIFQSFKHFIKVTAVDELTGIEVCMQTPKTLSKEQMEGLALQKLTYVLNKNNG